VDKKYSSHVTIAPGSVFVDTAVLTGKERKRYILKRQKLIKKQQEKEALKKEKEALKRQELTMKQQETIQKSILQLRDYAWYH
jgi:hypothetical protein